MVTKMTIDSELDMEWTELILEALNLGISSDKIRSFLNEDPEQLCGKY